MALGTHLLQGVERGLERGARVLVKHVAARYTRSAIARAQDAKALRATEGRRAGNRKDRGRTAPEETVRATSNTLN